MHLSQRAKNKDVSNTVDVTDPVVVTVALRKILDARYPDFDFSVLDILVADFARLYEGEYPGFQACDVGYHNIQHVLDVTLAMARLIDGHDGSCEQAEQVGAELALTGVACALFHDAGYIRRSDDNQHASGAAYTRVHVSRSAVFMAEYLPTVGLESLVPVCTRIVHFTGYEVNPDSIEVDSGRERSLGAMLGTADLIAQMADVDYTKKCRDQLYTEFEAGGMAGEVGLEGYEGTIFRSPQHLLESTPNFIRTSIEVRLDGYFNSVYRYAADHFGGANLYMDAIEFNCKELEKMLASGSQAWKANNST